MASNIPTELTSCDLLLNVLHFHFLQHLDRWQCFLNQHLAELGLERRPVEHSAQVLLLAVASTQIGHSIDDDFLRFEIGRQSPDVVAYIKKSGEPIFNSYLTAIREKLMSEPLTHEEYFAAGRIIYHQLFKCEVGFDPSNTEECAPDQIIMDCASLLHKIFFDYLDLCINLCDCAYGRKKIAPPHRKQLNKEEKTALKQFEEVRRQLLEFCLQHRARYVDGIASDFELDFFALFLMYESSKVSDFSAIYEKYPVLNLEFVSEVVHPLYQKARKIGKLEHVAYLRMCCASGKFLDLNRMLQIHVSDMMCEETAQLIASIRARFSACFSDRQKLFLCMAGAAVVLLAVAIATTVGDTKMPYGFFVFMRIVTCAALAGLFFEKLPIWAKFALLLLAILYNPVVPIHLGKREVWAWINAATIPALVIPWAWIWKKNCK